LHRLAALEPATYPVLFDSASRGPRSRYSILVRAGAGALWQDAEGGVHATRDARLPVTPDGGFLGALDGWWRAAGRATAATLPPAGSPWRGGFAVFLGYELAAEIEPRLRAALPPADEPCRAWALRTPAAFVWDEQAAELSAVAEPGFEELLEPMNDDLRRALECPQEDPRLRSAAIVELREDEPEAFLDGVRAAQDSIAHGDVYQLNLSRAWRGRRSGAGTLLGTYERLRASNPAPFAAWARWGGMEILSSSPERLVAVRDGVVSTRPIAGTRPRAPGSEAQDIRALAAHPKERAEHVMLIDLERNDLGRVCAPGSVQVTEFMTVETYAHVHHIVSEVQGRLGPGRSAIDALRAVFPGGTITGCPKIRCMELIAPLEGCGRGAYTGSIGFIGLDGTADFNILIRTLSICGDRVVLRAGAGIVADSAPQRELEETRAKARGVLAALQ
jgi:anthranilate synthase component 1